MRGLYLFCALIIFIFSCTSLKRPTLKQIEESAKIEQNKRRVGEKKRDPRLFVGESVVNTDKFGLEEAIQNAKEGARADLAAGIRLRVKATIEYEVSEKADENTSWFNSRIDSYTDMVLHEVKCNYYYPCPDQDYVTGLCWLSRKKYDEYVTEDLRRKKAKVLGFLKPGLEAINGRNFALALNTLIKAGKEIKKFFGETPIETEINGEKLELNSFTQSKIATLINNLEIKPLDKKVNYDAEGKPSVNPRVYVAYREEGGAEARVANIPLVAKIVYPTGEEKIVTYGIKTSTDGLAEIVIEHIDASKNHALLEVKLGEKEIGIQPEQKFITPICHIYLHKIQTIAISVVFFNNHHRILPVGFVDEVKQTLLDKGYGTIDYAIQGERVTNQDKRGAQDLHADYLLSMKITALGGGPDMYGMCWSKASSRIVLYSIPQGKELFALSGPSAKGEHVTVSGAGWEAFSKVKPGLIKLLKSKLK